MKSVFENKMLIREIVGLLGWQPLGQQMWARVGDDERVSEETAVEAEREKIKALQTIFEQLEERNDDRCMCETLESGPTFGELVDKIEGLKSRISSLETVSKAWRELNLRVRNVETSIERKAAEIAAVLNRPVSNGDVEQVDQPLSTYIPVDPFENSNE